MVYPPEMIVEGTKICIKLSPGMTAKKIVHQKLGSHGTADPLDLRERVLITLRPNEEF